MASSHPHTHWKAATFHFNSPTQSEDCRTFYIRALNYLHALDIEPDQADDNCKGWKQLKLITEGENIQALQTLIDNQTIMPEDMKKCRAALDAIVTTIKSEEHFWTHRDELISDIRQQPREGIHALSQHISDLITKCRFPHPKTQEMLKIMVLQHAVCYHEARDWIMQQDQSQLTYKALLSHCKLLESRCKMYQKAWERGHTDLASITAASASSIYANALITSAYKCCNKCAYSHIPSKCPAYRQQCYACGGSKPFAALCKQRRR